MSAFAVRLLRAPRPIRVSAVRIEPRPTDASRHRCPPFPFPFLPPRAAPAPYRAQQPDVKKEEFRRYLERSGVIDSLTKGARVRQPLCSAGVGLVVA